jgi:hypothetical protein
MFGRKPATTIEQVIDDLLFRARLHRIVAGFTLFGASGTFIIGFCVDMYLVYTFPEVSAQHIAPMTALISGIIVTPYLFGIVLATAYRYNIRVYLHYASRALVLRLHEIYPAIPLEFLVTMLDAKEVPMDKLPDWRKPA